ncbi:MAG: hypothetical protein ACYC5O_15125 [Anaerolineae bacterium]
MLRERPPGRRDQGTHGNPYGTAPDGSREPEDYRESLSGLTEDSHYTLVGGCYVTGERCRHWRERHTEVSLEIEQVMLARAILAPEHESRDPKDATVVRRYAQAEDGRWWRVAIKTEGEGGSFVLTFHRVQKPGR